LTSHFSGISRQRWGDFKLLYNLKFNDHTYARGRSGLASVRVITRVNTARACLPLFLVSAAFPVAASLLDRPSRWLGLLDVAVAALFVCVALTLGIRYRERIETVDRAAAVEASQLILAVVPLLLALFFIVGDRLNWNALVIGLAWRVWLLLYVLPAFMAARRGSRSRSR